MYNYYSIWIPENYPALKLVLMFFEKGDKELGLQQLEEVSKNAFYTRTEAQLFLMRILTIEENRARDAMPIAEYLHSTFPNNPYFHRFYARLLYTFGRYSQLETEGLRIIERIDSGMVGYEATSGRYASFFLAEMYRNTRQLDKSKHFYKRAIDFGEEIGATDTGYYLYSALNYAILINEEDRDQAVVYFEVVRKNTKKKHPANKRAKEYLKKKPKKKKSG